jgi:hypothetical protein
VQVWEYVCVFKGLLQVRVVYGCEGVYVLQVLRERVLQITLRWYLSAAAAAGDLSGMRERAGVGVFELHCGACESAGCEYGSRDRNIERRWTV